MKAHILIVEDEAPIYEHLRRQLLKEHYTVGEYAPSVADALTCIENKRPDMVLLDIKLQGEQTGLDLGKLLDKKYKIPFIYLTQFDDDQTFFSGLHTNHADFVVKNGKLGDKALIRSIQTVLHNHKKNTPQPEPKQAIMAYVDYIKNTKNLGNEHVVQLPIPYKDIAYFTTNSTQIDPEKTANTNKTHYLKVTVNNTRVCTWEGKSYIIPSNLSPIAKVLPDYFVRISDDYIVNISEDLLDGRINGKRLKIRGEVFTISDRYKAEVEKRFEMLYQKIK